MKDEIFHYLKKISFHKEFQEVLFQNIVFFIVLSTKRTFRLLASFEEFPFSLVEESIK